MKKNLKKSSLVLSAALLIGASAPSLYSVFAEESVESTEMMDHAMMEHDDEGRLPNNIKLDRDSTYKVGDEVIVNADHMPGMVGAEGVIVAAFDTIAYEVSYTPTDGGELVANHKWVVHEEIAGTNSRDEADLPLEVGAEVTLEAYHMPSMEGATATIDSVNETTVYLIDYTDTQSSELVMNHKWVTEDELSALIDDEVEETDDSSTSSQSDDALETEDESESGDSSDNGNGSESDDTSEESENNGENSDGESEEEDSEEESETTDPEA